MKNNKESPTTLLKRKADRLFVANRQLERENNLLKKKAERLFVENKLLRRELTILNGMCRENKVKLGF